MDKFTKWIEYKPILTLTADRVVTFIYDIIHCFGFPLALVLDFCERSSIEVKYISVAHPRTNGQVERANGLILDGLKKRLYDENSTKGSKWINEISSVVWGLRTQPRKATRQPPFFLVYGSEAILPADVM
jgi:hypothetical protein